jgi:hypothetical protein
MAIPNGNPSSARAGLVFEAMLNKIDAITACLATYLTEIINPLGFEQEPNAAPFYGTNATFARFGSAENFLA